jgi:hypothetical protein
MRVGTMTMTMTMTMVMRVAMAIICAVVVFVTMVPELSFVEQKEEHQPH